MPWASENSGGLPKITKLCTLWLYGRLWLYGTQGSLRINTYFELASMHFKLCTTHSKFLETHSKFFETHFKFTTNSEIFTTHFKIFTTHFKIFATHFENIFSQHICPRTPSVGREKGTVTQLLLLPSMPCFVPSVDNNYKKVLFFARNVGWSFPQMSPKEAAMLTARKISSKHTFWLVLSTTPLLASLKGSTVFTFRCQH